MRPRADDINKLKLFADRVLSTNSRMLCLNDEEHGVQLVTAYVDGSFILACGHTRQVKVSKINYHRKGGWGIEGVEY